MFSIPWGAWRTSQTSDRGYRIGSIHTVQVAEFGERYKKRQIVRICDACKATPGFADDVLTRMQAQVLEVLSESTQQDDPHVAA